MPERVTAFGHPADEEDVNQITELIAGLEASQNQHDAAKFDRQFTADTLFVTASGKRLRGYDEMHAYHQASLDRAPQGEWVRFTVLDLSFLSPDVAVGHTKQDYISPPRGANLGTIVLTKKNGAWWICAMHHTNDDVNRD